MTEILHTAKLYNRQRAFLILGCGHWFKWDTSQQGAPRPGTEFRCPNPQCASNSETAPVPVPGTHAVE